MNSKSDIIDELKTLRSLNSEKTKTLDDIIHQNLKNLEDIIDSKVINIYARPWVKLEPKLKMKKINEYINHDENKIDDVTKEKIIKYYMDKKKVAIKYNVELCNITEIKTNFKLC